MAEACPLVVFAPFVLSGDVLCGRLSRGMNDNDAGFNQNTADMVVGVWSLACFQQTMGPGKKKDPIFGHGLNLRSCILGSLSCV